MPMTLPRGYLGADLFWWQERTDLHTLITIPGNVGELNRLPVGGLNPVVLDFALFDSNGVLAATWQRMLAKHETCFVDSADASALPPGAARVAEGVVYVFVSAADEAEPLGGAYRRLYSLVDWYSSDGELVSLHNDQSVRIGAGGTEFREITFRETADDGCFLVLLNGPTEQRAAALELEIRNHLGESRTAVHRPPMQPFSVNKIHLNPLFPALVEFCDGQHATLSVSFDCRDIYVRPYVMTQGLHLSGHHGGDRYRWSAVPRFIHKLLGRGEVNPIVALHDDSLTTVVNLFNTHGDLEEDFWVDARLYDQRGVMVAERERWLQAKRNELVRGEVSALLPNLGQPFVGHIALNFSPDDKAFYRLHLQALLEYRTTSSGAGVMAWSDIWNGRERLRPLAEGSNSIVAPMVNSLYTIAPRGVQFSMSVPDVVCAAL